MKLVAVQQDCNYKKALELDNGSKKETDQLTEDWESAMGRNWGTAGWETDIIGVLDPQVEVVSGHLEVWLWRLVPQW